MCKSSKYWIYLLEASEWMKILLPNLDISYHSYEKLIQLPKLVAFVKKVHFQWIRFFSINSNNKWQVILSVYFALLLFTLLPLLIFTAQETADLVTFTEEIFNGKFHFCAVIYKMVLACFLPTVVLQKVLNIPEVLMV